MSRKKPIPQLYSLSCPKNLKNVVFSLTAPPATQGYYWQRFRTAIYTAKDGSKSWRSAVHAPSADSLTENNIWTVFRHDMPAGSDVAQQAIALHDVCLFDALHYMATFENSERTLGAIADHGREPSLPAHAPAWPECAAIADAALIPRDVQGFPHPAAGGIILTPGTFDKAAYDLAAKTHGRTLDPAAAQKMQAEIAKALMKNNNVPKSAKSARPGTKKALAEAFNEAILSVTNVKDALDVAMAKGFGCVAPLSRNWQTCLGLGGGVATIACGILLMGPLGPVLLPVAIGVEVLGMKWGASIERKKVSSVTKFDETFAEFQIASSFLDEKHQKLMLDFSNAARNTFALEHIAAEQDNKKLIKHYTKTCGWAPEHAARLEQGGLAPGSFAREFMENYYKPLIAKLAAARDALAPKPSVQ